jgi:hypothetical protein
VLQIFWQIRQVDKISGSSNGCTGHDILKLPHIARPDVLQQHRFARAALTQKYSFHTPDYISLQKIAPTTEYLRAVLSTKERESE